VRLNAYLARAGVASRRRADELIKAGRVVVNGEPGRLNTFVERGDRVEVDGKPVVPQRLTYVLLNKPTGTVTTARDPQGRPTVVDLIDLPERVVPVGRLDADTTGLILLTNDGELANRLMHPRHEVPRTYVAKVQGGFVKNRALERLREGVVLDDGKTAPAQVRQVRPGVLELTIHEGRKRQVRRMCEAVGHRVLALRRVRFGPLELGRLDEGKARPLKAAEVRALKAAAGMMRPHASVRPARRHNRRRQ
jgi:23S rRNA pseudouridine2605 synthase